MTKKIYTLSFVLLTALLPLHAQNPVLPDGMEILTPEGVILTTQTDRVIFDKAKNLVISGSRQKGYKVYFTATDDEHGEELWVSDGTAEGTRLVKDIFEGPVSSDVKYITRFNDCVVFSATQNDDEGSQLFISDGTAEGTRMVKLINEIGATDPCGFVQLNETQFIFAAVDLESAVYGDDEQHWLWVSDGTEEGTRLLKDCWVKYPGTKSGSDVSHFCRVGRKVFFKADTKDGEYTETLWVTDGTEGGTTMLGDINTTVADETTGQTGSARIDWMTNVNNKWLFFGAYSAEAGAEPWASDGTPEGTRMIIDDTTGEDANGLPNGTMPFTTCVMGDYIYYRGMDPTPDHPAGIELIRTDGTAEGTELVLDINKVPNATGTNGGVPDIFPFCVFDGYLWGKGQWGVNSAYDFCRGLELFITDGTPEGSYMQSDLNPGVGNNAAWEGTVVSGSMYFRAQDKVPTGSQTWELFRVDSYDDFPVQVVDLAEGIDYVHSLRNLDGDLVFTSTAVPRLFKYHYRKADYDPDKDCPPMDIDFDGMSNVYNGHATGIKRVESGEWREGKELVTIGNKAGTISVKAESGVRGCQLCDLTGRTVRNYRHEGQEILIGTRGIPSGAYIVKVQTATGREVSGKILVK